MSNTGKQNQNSVKEDRIPSEVIDRLAAEKAEHADEDREIGIEVGFEWAKDAHYDEIRSVVNEALDANEFCQLVTDALESCYGSIWKAQQGLGFDSFASVLEGFAQGVNDFYAEVEPLLEQ